MKLKNGLFIILPALLVIGGCFGNNTPVEEPSLTGQNTMPETKTLAQCQIAVDAYLADMAKESIDSTKTATASSTVSVQYIGRLADGTVFDTSVESVAKECDVYSQARNSNELLSFHATDGQVIQGFKDGVIGMNLNETKTINIASKDAYGDETTIEVAKSDIGDKPDGTEFAIGDVLMSASGPVSIVALSGDTVTLSNPNPLAGKDLIFDITLKEIK